MCGITGIINLNKQNINLQNLIFNMTRIIRHRGPDDEGFVMFSDNRFIIVGGDDTPKDCYNSGFLYSPKIHISSVKGNFNIALGHRRLSILDLTSAGHQPMCSDNGKIWVIHNGEIYNYIELRYELKNKGFDFQTQTDTEVVLKSYEHWGEDCVKKFNGMWAFAILDLEKDKIFCSRDRFGIKPFYYYYDKNYFAFASEIKALLSLPFVPKDINDLAVYNYVIWSTYEDTNTTFYNDIKKLTHSNNLVLNLKTRNLKIYKYYNLKLNSEFGQFSERKAKDFAEGLKYYITNAVKLRLRSDVPIGTCLSGGLDSSTIFMIVNNLILEGGIVDKKLVGDHQKAFSSCFEDIRFDERVFAEEIVKVTGAEWYCVFPNSKELWDDLSNLVFYHDEPFGSTSIYAQYRVMKLAKESGVKVILDGQGGDELFGGYVGYIKYYLSEFLKVHKNPIEIYKLIKNLKIHSHISSIKGIGKELLKALAMEISTRKVINFVGRNRKLGYLNHNFLNSYKKYEKNFEEISDNELNVILYKDMIKGNLQKLLIWEDCNSMAHSIESRTPFADDHNLIEFVFSMPACYKINNGWSKWILREAMKGILPEKIRKRRYKKGFITSEEIWLKENRDNIIKIFINNKNKLKDYISVEKIIDNLDNILNYHKGTGIPDFWRFLNLALWIR